LLTVIAKYVTAERHCRSLNALVLTVAAALWLTAGATGLVRAGDRFVIHDVTGACDGECAIHVYGGKYVDTSMLKIAGPEAYTAPWDWQWLESGIVAAAFSRPVISVPDYWQIEAEFGVAKRFGTLTALEGWAALYFRWNRFPWNKHLKTSIAISAGLNYADHIDHVEVTKSGNGEGSNLLHFFSPEIAFSLPQSPEVELVFRFHHRSGGKAVWGGTKIFNSTLGGAQYGTMGLRVHY